VTEPQHPDIDMLTWFSDEERERCSSCGERASVTLQEGLATMCLACRSITVDGKRFDQHFWAAENAC
jgi:hypothetical protein